MSARVPPWEWTQKSPAPWFLYRHTERRPIMHAKGEEKMPFRSWAKQFRHRAASRRLWGYVYFSPVRR